VVVVVETLENSSLLLNKCFQLVLVVNHCGTMEYLGDDVKIVYLCLFEQLLVGEDVLEVVDLDEGVEESGLVVVIDVGQ